jgi:lysophospholipase L1-like esterase
MASPFPSPTSTNDAGRNVPIEQTEAAIRFIVEYVTEAWNCPVVFYTGTFFENEHYQKMIDLLRDLQKELGFHILDLWDDPAMRPVSEEDYKRYMHDPVHPNIEGYRSWWTPKFIEFCQGL